MVSECVSLPWSSVCCGGCESGEHIPKRVPYLGTGGVLTLRLQDLQAITQDGHAGQARNVAEVVRAVAQVVQAVNGVYAAAEW